MPARWIISTLPMLSAVLAVLLPAQRGAPADAPPAKPSPSRVEPVRATGRSDLIYVPYEDLGRAIAGKDRKVMLPYDEFMELWNAARRVRSKAGTEPPLAAVLTQATYTGKVQGGLATIDAEIHVRVLQEQWVRIPIRLADVAMLEATVGGEAPVLVARPGGWDLVLVGQGEHVLKIRFVCPVKGTPAKRQIEFSCAPVPIGRLELIVPGRTARVEVQPVDHSTTKSISEGETQILALVGKADKLLVSWEPQAQGPTDLPNLLAAEVHVAVSVGPGATMLRSTFAVSVLRGQVSRLDIHLPKASRHVGTTCRVRHTTDVIQEAGRTTVRVELAEPTEKDLVVGVSIQQPRDDPERPITIAAPVLAGVDAQSGVVAITASDRLALQVIRTHSARQIDVSELPKPLADTPAVFAFAYTKPGPLLELSARPVRPTIEATATTLVSLRPDGAQLATHIEWTVLPGEVSQLQVRFGPNVHAIEVVASEGIDSPEIQATRRARLLSLPLNGKADRRISLDIRATLAALPDTGRLRLPLPELLGVQRPRGAVVVASEDSLTVTPVTGESPRIELLDATALEAVRVGPVPADGLTTRCGYRYSVSKPDLVVSVARREPELRVEWMGRLRLDAESATWSQRLRYDIRYRAIDSVSLLVPSAMVERLKLSRPGLRWVPDEPAGPAAASGPSGGAAATKPASSVPAGYTRGRVTLAGPTLGALEVEVRYALSLPRPPGPLRHVPLTVLPVVPEGVVSLAGQVQAVFETDNLVLEPRGDNLRTRAGDGDRGAPSESERTFAARRPTKPLEWFVIRSDADDAVVDVMIDRALTETVIADTGRITCHVRYLVSSARQGRLVVRLPSGSRILGSPRIDGDPRAARPDAAPRTFRLDLSRVKSSGKRFLVEFVYQKVNRRRLGAVGGLALEPPRLLGDVIVGRTFWRVFMPKTYAVVATSTDFVDENLWQWRGVTAVREPRLSRADVRAWVEQPASRTTGLTALEAVGRDWLYSSQTSRESLRLTYVRQPLLVLLSSGLVLALGLALIRASAAWRLAVLAGAVAVLCPAAFFASTVVLLVLDAALLGVLLVLVAWASRAVLVRRRALAARRARARRRKALEE